MINISKLVCFFIGHKKVVPMLKEDLHCIYTRCCLRCSSPSIGGVTWKNCLPPPNSTNEQIEEFNKERETHYNEVRLSIKQQID